MSKYTKKQLATWKKNRAAWVKALRSGEYEQCRARLFNGMGYCCLGVLCKVAGLEPDTAFMFDGSSRRAPSRAKAFVGLATSCGEWKLEPNEAYGFKFETLAWRNDDGNSFFEIADIIESEPPGLFLESLEASDD